MNFFAQQERARRNTRLLLPLFLLTVLLIVLLLNAVAYLLLWYDLPHSFGYWFEAGPWLPVTALVLIVILGAMVKRAWELRGGGEAVAEMLGAEPLVPNSEEPELRRFVNVVEEMAIASGMPVPKLYLLEEPGINAFVAGLQPERAVMVVTRGALEQLDRDELQGVVGHEFSHIFHGDMRINLRLISLLAGIMAIGQIGGFMLKGLFYTSGSAHHHRRHTGFSAHHHRSDSRGGVGGGQAVFIAIFLGLSLFVIGYTGLFVGRLIQRAVSRRREYLADASSVQYTRNKRGLAMALAKIQHGSGSRLFGGHSEELSHLCIANPLSNGLFGWMSTHPPLEKRIERLGYKHLLSDYAREELTPGVEALAAVDEAIPPSAAPMMIGDGPSLASASLLAGSIGDPQPLNLDYAVALLAQLPDGLREAAHDQQRASVLLYALIHRHNQAEEARAMALLGEQDPQLDLQQFQLYVGQCRDLPTRLRLPLLELCLPALQRLDDEGQQRVITTCEALAAMDGSYSLFEFSLMTLLRRRLLGGVVRRPRSISSYQPVLGEIAFVLALLLRTSGMPNSQRKALYQRLMRSFSEQPVKVPRGESLLQQLERALARLDGLPMLLKQPLVEACADCVLADNMIKPEELELLRAVTESIGCPMPPLPPVDGMAEGS